MNLINNTNISDMQLLMEDVFSRIKDKDKYGLNGDILIEEYDEKRVYFTANNVENTLRIWDTTLCGKYIKFRWSLFIENNCIKQGITKIA